MPEHIGDYQIAQSGSMWRVTDPGGTSYWHLTEASARAACHPDITTGVIPETSTGTEGEPS